MKKPTKLTDLIPDARNANKGTPRGLTALDKSLRQYGAGRSILIDKNNRIIAGNKTQERAVDIGLDENVIIVETDGTQLVAVKRTDLDLETDPAARELAYYDNRVGQLDLDWDIPTLEFDLSNGLDLDGLFSEFDLKDMGIMTGDGEVTDVEPQLDRAAELQEKWQVQPGELFEIGEHRLICGDCTDATTVARLMGGEEHTLMTDPPYGIDAASMTMGSHQSSIPKSARLSNVDNWDNEAVDVTSFVNRAKYSCVWGAQYLALNLPVSDDWLCWDKKNPNLSFSEFELAWSNYGLRARIISHHWGSERKSHITQKPLPVIEWALRLCPDKDLVICDPFLGSGTTMVASQNLSRRCYGVEISPAYCAVILERMTTAFPDLEITRHPSAG